MTFNSLFSLQICLPLNNVLGALQTEGSDGSSIARFQRKSGGEILLTFRKAELKEKFVCSSVLKENGAQYAIQDVDQPLTFVQVFDGPHKLPNRAIIQCLAPFCEVVTYSWGVFCKPGWENVQDGSPHYRVRVKNPIPSYMQFGKIFVQFCYVQQPNTCHLCHSPSHFVNACHSIICFNCEKTGYLASNCPAPVACNIYKSTIDLANKLSFFLDRFFSGKPSADTPPEAQ